MALRIIRTFDINEAQYAGSRGMIKLTLRGRNTFTILETVIVAKNTQIQIALVELSNVNLISPAVTGRQVFKQKYRKKPSQQRISFHEPFDRLTLDCQFILNAADKYSLADYCHVSSRFVRINILYTKSLKNNRKWEHLCIEYTSWQTPFTSMFDKVLLGWPEITV